MEDLRTYTAFCGERQLATGDVRTVLLHAKRYVDGGGGEPLLVFEDQSGMQTELELEGTEEQALARLAADPAFAAALPQPVKPGRPKLGVVAREITLLPRHWEWLDRQPGGSSAALRRLVESASKNGRGKEQARAAREAAGKFMWAMTGNLPDFEEATRALYAKDQARLEALIRDWPVDLRKHVERLSREAARLEAAADEAREPDTRSM